MSPTPNLDLEVVDDLAGFDALRQEWDAALAASADPNVFLTWEWLRTWWRHFGETDPGARLHVVVLRDADGLVAGAPLFHQERRGGPLRVGVLRQISFDAGDYGGVLLARHHDQAVDILLRHLGEQLRRGVGTVHLSRLADDSTFLARLRTRLRQVGRAAGVRAVETPLDGACPYADVREGYNLQRHLKKHKVRQRMRRISEKYATEFTWHTGPNLEEGLARLVDVHRQRWEGREDELQGQLADPEREEFLLDAIRALDGQGWLRLLVLTADGRTVGAELDFEFARRVSMFKGAFDPDFAEFSPGQLLTYRLFEEGIASGVEEFDFLRGDHPYKRRWTNAERHLTAVALTRPGIAGTVARTRLRAVQALSRRRRG
jgi:CelD/BcsL family acetyltransferase involved in cellulose biosynthesis